MLILHYFYSPRAYLVLRCVTFVIDCIYRSKKFKTLRKNKLLIILACLTQILSCGMLIYGCITPKPTEADPLAPGLINLDTTSGYTPRIGDRYRFDVRWTTTRFDPLPDGWVILDSIAAFLRFHKQIVCEIGVHTDFRASKEYNDTFTCKRAKSLTDYITGKGIDPARIISVGYGERVPRILEKQVYVPEWKTTFPKGVRLTEEFINQLKTYNEKEAAHYLNRRVELVITGIVQKERNQFYFN
jgi:outer membrane protein OmpA-like peptidoglycan-associated protein